MSKKQVAIALGMDLHNIKALVRAKLLTPLGRPAQNSQKWFARTEVEQIASDRTRLHKCELAIEAYWKQRRASRGEEDELDESED